MSKSRSDSIMHSSKHTISHKILGVQPDKMRQKLQELGASCVFPLRRIQRYIFSIPTIANESSEGQKSTFLPQSLQQMNKNSISTGGSSYVTITRDQDKTITSYKALTSNETEEFSLEVGDGDVLRKIYKACGLQEKSIQEMYKETRALQGTYIQIERRPGLKPFINIVGGDNAEDTKRINHCLESMGYNENEIFIGGIRATYAHELGVSESEVNSIPTITFDNPPISTFDRG